MPCVARENQNGRPRARRVRWTAKSDGSQLRRRLQRVEVLGRLGVGAPCPRRVAVEERAAVERREEPLVRVDRERVAALDAVEQVPRRGGGERGGPVRAVDVEPEPALLGHACDAGEVVDDAEVGAAGGGDHGEDVVGALRVELARRARRR